MRAGWGPSEMVAEQVRDLHVLDVPGKDPCHVQFTSVPIHVTCTQGVSSHSWSVTEQWWPPQ